MNYKKNLIEDVKFNLSKYGTSEVSFDTFNNIWGTNSIKEIIGLSTRLAKRNGWVYLVKKEYQKIIFMTSIESGGTFTDIFIGFLIVILYIIIGVIAFQFSNPM